MWSKLLYVIAIEFDLIDTAIRNIVKNLIPGLADDCITDWEEVLGLPEVGTPSGLSLAQRQNIAHAKYITNYDGLSRIFFLGFASNMGSSITIIENYGGGEPFRVDHARVDRTIADRVDGARLWSLRVFHIWEVRISTADPNKDILHLIFENIKPAHTQLVWTEV